MKFTYLGTAAGECIPGMFCTCEVCERSKQAGGRNIRSRSQAIVDGRLLIDFGPDTYYHVIRQTVDLAAVESCIITHAHTDHLRGEDFELRRHGIAYLKEEIPLQVFGPESVGEKVWPVIRAHRLHEEKRVFFNQIRPFVPFDSGRYRITPLKASHGTPDPVIYLIERGGKMILYAHDTGYFPEETWDYLLNHRIKPDFVSLDCTCGIREDEGNHHMGLEMAVSVKKKMEESGMTLVHTRFCLNHFSHNGLVTYDEMAPLARKNGFLVSYDGMTVEV